MRNPGRLMTQVGRNLYGARLDAVSVFEIFVFRNKEAPIAVY